MKDFTAKQTRALGSLANGTLNKDVAREIGVSPQTISEWKSNPLFKAKLDDLKREILDRSHTAINGATSDAVEALRDIIKHSKHDETRRKAALDILKLAGFEPGNLETYGWGIGSGSFSEIQMEYDLKMSDLLSDCNSGK